MTYSLIRTTSILAISLFAACTLEPVDNPDLGPGGAETPYRDGFIRVNSTPFASEVAGDSLIDVWVSEFAAEQYAKVKLDGKGSGVSLPTGTVIVREVLDQAGEIQTLTIMIKDEPGYFPLGGNYWYAVAEPDGTIRENESGELLMGRLESCGSCHAGRPNDDFLFGTPSDH